MGRPVYPDPHPLLRYRISLGISLRGLARKARLKDFRRLAIIERGLSTTEITRLAAVLHCDPADLQFCQTRQEDRHVA